MDDAYGALTLGAAGLHGVRDLRVHQDLLVGELALAANAERTGPTGSSRSLPLDGDLFAGARVVLAKAPKGLDALRELTELVAAHAAPDVTLLVGGRVKHMTHAMNDVLRTGFADVTATLARQKSRLLVARGPPPGTATTFPRCRRDEATGLTVCAHGAAFAGTRVDDGTRALLAALAGAGPDARTALDLGCGTGVLAAALARDRPELTVLASDQSAAAVASATATAAANGLGERVRVSPGRRGGGRRGRQRGPRRLQPAVPRRHLRGHRGGRPAVRRRRPGAAARRGAVDRLQQPAAAPGRAAPAGRADPGGRRRPAVHGDGVHPALSQSGASGQWAGRALRRRTGGCEDHGKSIHRSVCRHT